MDFPSYADLFSQHRSLVVFINVLLQQLGLPVPAFPTMMLNASQVKEAARLFELLMAAVSASLIADLLWYQAGKMFGYRVLNLLCKMSISPGSCVNQTEARFNRWGVWSLVVGKFIPGFSTVAPPVAGALGMPLVSFMFASSIGAALWAGLALLAGYALQVQFNAALALLSLYGIRIAFVFGAILLLWLSWKFWQKKRFERLSSIAHMSVADLARAYAEHRAPRVIDLRSATLIAETGSIPGAINCEFNLVATVAKDWPRTQAIVTVCACPADAAAVHAAHTLQKMGFIDVQPLAGGIDAWMTQSQTQAGLLSPAVTM